MKILVSGASGLIGRALLPALAAENHFVVRLKTGATPGDANIVPWQPLAALDPRNLTGFDAVIHLAGENLFGRWNPAKKQAIYDSRVLGTRNLCDALTRVAQKPRVLLAASAVGYYGAKHTNEDEFVTEDSPPGEDFLARLCCDWEAATAPAVQAGIRVVNLRFGIVLSAAGGALKKMLTPFRLGLGGSLGSGKQWMSWIAIQDVVVAIRFCLNNENIRGPVNLV